MTQPAV